MTATTTEVFAPLDLDATPRPTMGRLVGVELRKMSDTRAGMWLLIAIGVITAGIIAIFLATAKDADRTFLNFMGATAVPQGILLPVLGILLVTSEWGQRTAMVTFSLTPSRGRVLAAKTGAAVLVGLAAIAAAIAIAALATLVGGNAHAWAGIGWASFGKFALLQSMGIVEGLAFGMVLLNSSAAIVLFFVVPTVITVVSSSWSALAHARPWIDLNTSQPALYSGHPMTGALWAHLGVGALIWIVLPFVLGTARVMRREVK
ncbi:MAG: ABC transporter permease [Nocardioidaceae bacterium]